MIEKSPSDKEGPKILGIAYHNLGILKVSGAPDKAVEYLEKVYQLSPDDYEVLAYLGSAKTMIARDSWNVFIKVSSVNKGVNLIDRSVSRSPDNIAIRMVRANNSLNLPGFFNRRHLAKKDFLYIKVLIERSPSGIDSDTKAEVFYQLGVLYKSEGDKSSANTYLKKAVETSPNSEWGMKARKEL